MNFSKGFASNPDIKKHQESYFQDFINFQLFDQMMSNCVDF